MEERARDLLRRVGVHEDLSDDDFRDILAASTGSTGSVGSEISVPAAILADIASPAFRDTRPRRASGAAEAAVPAARATLSVGEVADTRKLQQCEARIESLEEQLSVAVHEKRLLELESSRRVRSLQEQLASTREESVAAVTAARTAQVTAEAALAQMREKMEASKSGFSDLVVSAALYEELTRSPVEELSLRQYIQVKVHEVLLPLKADLEAVRREAEAAKGDAAAQLAAFERNTRDLQTRTALAEGRETALREEVRMKESMVQRLQTSLNAALAQVEALHGKGAAFDSTETRRRELEALRDKDAALLAAATATAEAAKADKEAAVSEARAARAKAEALAADKATLSSQLEDARAAGRRLTDQLAVVEDARRDAVRQRDAYHEQLLRLQVETRTAAEERVESEVRRLRESAALEMDSLRVATTDGYEREVKALREDRASLTATVERLTQRADALQQSLEQARAGAAADAAEAARVTAELRGALKTKAYELERVSLTAAEASEALRKRSNEADALRERLAALQTAHDRQCVEAERQLASLEAALAGERERLAMYDRLETELDDAVLLAAYEKPEPIRSSGAETVLGATAAADAETSAPAAAAASASAVSVPATAHVNASYESDGQGYSDDEFAAASDAEEAASVAKHASRPAAAATATTASATTGAAPERALGESASLPATANRQTQRLHGTGTAAMTLADALASGVPTTARRRLRQCMLLAKELLAAQNEIAALQQRHAEMRGRLEAAVAEGDEARRQLELVSGPHAYLVAALRDREADLKAARAHIVELREELNSCRAVLADVQAAKDGAQRELRRVLTARSDVKALADLVQAALATRPAIELGHATGEAHSAGMTGPPSADAATLDPFVARYLQDRRQEASRSYPPTHTVHEASHAAHAHAHAHAHHHHHHHHQHAQHPHSDSNSVASCPLSAGDLFSGGGDGASTPSSAGPTRETPVKAPAGGILSPPARSSMTAAAAHTGAPLFSEGTADAARAASHSASRVHHHGIGLPAPLAASHTGSGWGGYAAESPAATGLVLLPDTRGYGSSALDAVTPPSPSQQQVVAMQGHGSENAPGTATAGKAGATMAPQAATVVDANNTTVRTVYALAAPRLPQQQASAVLGTSPASAGRWHSRTVLL